MTTIDGYLGFTREDLTEAFERVSHPDDWRGPIWSIIKPEEVDVTRAAVTFFVGAAPVIARMSPHHFVVVSDGYRNGPAGP